MAEGEIRILVSIRSRGHLKNAELELLMVFKLVVISAYPSPKLESFRMKYVWS